MGGGGGKKEKQLRTFSFQNLTCRKVSSEVDVVHVNFKNFEMIRLNHFC